MFVTKKSLPRRTFLRAMGTTIALPFLDAMVPALSARAFTPTPRFGFVYIANGVIQNQWTPATTGSGFELTPTLSPFASLRDKITVLSGLSHLQADTFGDRHRRSSARVGGVADRRARLRPDTAGRRGEAGADRRSTSWCARSARRRASRRSRCRSISHPGLVRLRRLLLCEHRLVAQRDDAEQYRVASAESCLSACSATGAARKRASRAVSRR
jgi:hypothetical protein